MDKVINLGIPHVGEQIFASLGEADLSQCHEVSQTWKILSEKALLLKTWKGKMLEACQTGRTEIVKLLLDNYNCEESGMNVKSRYDLTPFMKACQNGHKDVVKLLLDSSKGTIELKLNARDGFGWTALMHACFEGHKNVVKLLLDDLEGNTDLKCKGF